MTRGSATGCVDRLRWVRSLIWKHFVFVRHASVYPLRAPLPVRVLREYRIVPRLSQSSSVTCEAPAREDGGGGCSMKMPSPFAATLPSQPTHPPHPNRACRKCVLLLDHSVASIPLAGT